jgi:YesN/AraC family two-component response regulator
VIDASNGTEAMGLSARYPGVIHMMITDVVMPEMNGRELADQLKVQRPEMKILFMSGYTADVIVQRGIDDNVVGLLRKPFSQAALAGKVREVLAGPERAS